MTSLTLTRGRRALASVIVVSCGLLALSRCPIGRFSTRELDPRFVEITRSRYYLRHWLWSGIFPLEGGPIGDPHVAATEVYAFPDDVRQRLGATSARFQGFDVNPWFRDGTSEIVLAIEVDGRVHEYRIRSSGGPRLDFGFINFPEAMIAFLYGDRLAFATCLSISKLAFLSTALPLRPDGDMAPAFEGTDAFDSVVRYLREDSRYLGLRDQLCRQWKPYRALYERFEPCPPLPPWRPHYGKGT